MYRDRDDRGDRGDRGGSRGGYGGGYSGGGGGGNFGGGDRQRFAPVKEGDELDVKIEAVGEKGDGIAKKQGFVLFVPKTKTGDEVRIKVTKVLKSAGFAEVIGQATSVPAPSVPHKKKEEEFAPKTENDSESFGEEGEAEAVAEKSDDDSDENSEEVQED